MGYQQIADQKLNALRNGTPVILAIESSCDETAAAVVRGRTVLSSVISTQIEIHKRFGGVVPEIASRNHLAAIDAVVRDALRQANLDKTDLDAVAVTYGAGLLGALLVGVSYAKAYAYALGLPLIAVDHIKGHVAANYIAHPDLQPPYLCLITSGGHTEIRRVDAFDRMEVLGSTRDDAVGEAFDKVARVLGLSYPGGPAIERLATEGAPTYPMPVAFKGEKHLDFSYSGIKTAVINLAANAKARGEEIRRADLARSFQDAAVSMLVGRAAEAVRRTGIRTVALAGGVGANSALRDALSEAGKRQGLAVLLPPKPLCTDNAAMIGVAAFEEIRAGATAASLSLDADPDL